MSSSNHLADITYEHTASSTDPMEPKRKELCMLYEQLCISYHAIDDFRAKLLGFLPLATGAGIFFLFNNISIEGEMKNFLASIGVFGFVVTLGLFAYELYGIRKCHALIEAGRAMESKLHLVDGQFLTYPDPLAGFINEPFAAGIIYSAALASWLYLALSLETPEVRLLLAGLVFLAGVAGSLRYNQLLRAGRVR